MRVHSVGHEVAIGSWHGGRATRPWSGRRATGSTGIAIGRGDAVGGLRRLVWLRSIGVTTKTGALQKMLLLSRGVLCANLLAVDALHGKTLQVV